MAKRRSPEFQEIRALLTLAPILLPLARERKTAWLTQTEGPCAAGSTGRPLVCKTSCGQERPRSLARGSAHEAPHGFFNAPRLNRGRLGKRAASPLPLSASPRLAAAQFGPGRLGRSDVKFHLSRPFGNVVRLGRLLFGAALNCSGVTVFRVVELEW